MGRPAAKYAGGAEELKGELLYFDVKTATGWGVGGVREKHDGPVTKIAGVLMGVKPGCTLKMRGTMEHSPRYGAQFKVTSCEVIVPQDDIGVIGWLASTLPQISKRRAEQLVQAHGVDGTWKVLESRDVTALCQLDGITPPRAAEIFDAYHANKAERDRLVALKGYGLTDNQIGRVVEQWGDKALEKLQENPYQLMEHVTGFGWERSDEIALRMGLPKNSEARIGAALRHKMDEAKQQGHCYVPSAYLVKSSAKVLGLTEDVVWPVLNKHTVTGGKFRLRSKGVYLPGLDDAEGAVASALAKRVQSMNEQQEQSL